MKDIKVEVFFLEITEQIFNSTDPSKMEQLKKSCMELEGKLFAPYLIDSKEISLEDISSINPSLLISKKHNSMDIRDIRKIVLFPDNDDLGMSTVKFLIANKMLSNGDSFIISKSGEMMLHNETEIEMPPFTSLTYTATNPVKEEV